MEERRGTLTQIGQHDVRRPAERRARGGEVPPEGAPAVFSVPFFSFFLNDEVGIDTTSGGTALDLAVAAAAAAVPAIIV